MFFYFSGLIAVHVWKTILFNFFAVFAFRMCFVDLLIGNPCLPLLALITIYLFDIKEYQKRNCLSKASSSKKFILYVFQDLV